MNEELANAILASAQRIGADPADLATVISYESGGTFSPNIWGRKGGNHLGMIQFGGPERERYGVREGMPVGEHLKAVESYLTDRGFKPGMGMLDLYSTVNAGRPGLYNRSDAANGGAPGTVADKVATQMGPHRAKAMQLLGMAVGAPPSAAARAPMAPSESPMALPTGEFSAPAAIDPSILAALQAIAKAAQQDDGGDDLEMIEFGTPPGIARARARVRQRRG